VGDFQANRHRHCATQYESANSAYGIENDKIQAS
jgi:hypothetical protein